MTAGRVEAKITVPSSVTISATNSGGGPTSVSLTAGPYYWTAAGSISGLAAHIQSQLNTTRALSSGAWSVAVSPNTGLLTIDCTSGAKLTKSGGTDGTNDAGANITSALTGAGFVEMTAAASAGSTRVVMGLAPSNASAGRDSGYYFELVEAGQLWVRELGVDIGQVSTWADGDVLRVRRTGTVITYEKNGAVVATSTASVSGDLFGDFSLKNTATSAVGIRLHDGTAYQAVAWSNVTNVTTSATTFSIAWTSTDLRDLCGFAADISAANAPQTGTKHVRGMWRPGCALQLGRDPRTAPKITDLRTTISPTGVALGLTGNSMRRHQNLTWPYVSITQMREGSAVYAGGSYETFLDDTQFGDGHSWFSVLSPVQVYGHDGTLLGSDLNGGTGSDGWSIIGVDSNECDESIENFAGLFKVVWPKLVSP